MEPSKPSRLPRFAIRRKGKEPTTQVTGTNQAVNSDNNGQASGSTGSSSQVASSTPASGNVAATQPQSTPTDSGIAPVNVQRNLQDTWAAAYEALEHRDAELIRAYEECAAQYANSAVSIDRPSDVTKIVDAAVQRRDDQRLVLQINNHVIGVREQLEKTLKFVVWSKDVVTTALAAQPYAALAWSCVTLFAPLLLQSTTQSEKMSSGINHIALLLQRYKAREEVTRPTNDSVVATEFRNAVIALYTEVFDFQFTATVHLAKPGFRRLMLDTVEKNAWDGKIEDIQRLDVQCTALLEPIKLLEEQRRVEASSAQREAYINGQHDMIAILRQMHEEQKTQTAVINNLLSAPGKANETDLTAQTINHEASDEAQRSAYLKALDYGERLFKQQQVDQVYTSNLSFEWVWNSPFSQWLTDQQPLFWIAGHPASGKSTLINYLVTSPRVKKVLKTPTRQKWDVLHFFFDFRAEKGLGNSIEGLLRSILLQLLHKFKDLTRHLTIIIRMWGLEALPYERSYRTKYSDNSAPLEAFEDRGLTSLKSFSKSQLRKAVFSCLDHLLTPVCIFLDGLDEFLGNRFELVSFIKELCHLKNTSGTAMLKICMASRPDPPLPDAFVDTPTFNMQDLNLPGLTVHAREKFKIMLPSYQKHSQDELTKLIEKIAVDSRGMFLWASFAVDEILTGISDGEEIGSTSITRRLEQMPPELHDVYARMFSRIPDGESRGIATAILLLTIYANDTLTVIELQRALSIGTNCFDENLEPSLQHFSEQICAQSQEAFKKFLLAKTRGFLEIIYTSGEYDDRADSNHDKSFYVRTIHKTVDSYLGVRGWEDLSGKLYSASAGHEAWLKIFSKIWLSYRHRHATRICELMETIASRALNANDLLRSYASSLQSEAKLGDGNLPINVLQYLYYHAKQFEQLSKSPSDQLLQPLLSSGYFIWHHMWNNVLEGPAMTSPSNPHTCLCYWALYTWMKSSSPKVFTDAIAYATLHRLKWTVRKYIEPMIATNGQAREPSYVSEGVMARHQRRDHPIVEQSRFEDLKKLCILSVAESGDDRDGLEILDLYLAVDTPTEVTLLLISVCRSHPQIVKRLLSTKPEKPWSVEKASLSRIDRKTCWIIKWHPGSTYGIFWFLAARLSEGRSDYKQCIDILEMLTEAGENPNHWCSPDGNLLCSYIGNLENRNSKYQEAAVEALISHGVNINGRGPSGTAIDLAWHEFDKFAHRNSDYRECSPALSTAINHLIRLGAVPSRADSNGSVRTTKEMLYFVNKPRKGI